MIHYIDTIEQTNKDGEVNEYGKREQVKGDYETVVLPKFYKKLSDVSADLITESTPDKKHYYMVIKIVDTTGGVKKEDTLGKRQETDGVVEE